MSPNSTNAAVEIRPLTDAELTEVNGGLIWIPAFLLGVAVGFALRDC